MKKIQDLTENHNDSRGMDCTDFVQKLRIFAFSPLYHHSRRNPVKTIVYTIRPTTTKRR